MTASAPEHIEEEIKSLNEGKEIFAEAKGDGFDAKVLKEILRLRKQSKDERDEHEFLRGAMETPDAQPERLLMVSVRKAYFQGRQEKRRAAHRAAQQQHSEMLLDLASKLVRAVSQHVVKLERRDHRCQSALKREPGSASKRDPFGERVCRSWRDGRRACRLESRQPRWRVRTSAT